MNILVLGGTGAMGVPLVNLLTSRGDNVFVTTRSPKKDSNAVTYLIGNAKEESFFLELMRIHYDAIIDFMVYSTDELAKRLPTLLAQTDQYIFFSSSRCYANVEGLIREDSPRLVDICNDQEYLVIDEYGMAKGREENLIKASGKKNWTIIRPYITYNSYRLQLGVYEKEDWLHRAMNGKTIIFPKDIAGKRTSMTYGPDVAAAVLDLIGNEKAYGESFHITTDESHTWKEILDFYREYFEKKTGKVMKVKMVNDSKGLQSVWNPWQIKYDRLYDRVFDNTKIEAVRGVYTFKPTFQGLRECLDTFFQNPKWLGLRVTYEAWCDRQVKELTSLNSFTGKRNKLLYIKHRFLW